MSVTLYRIRERKAKEAEKKDKITKLAKLSHARSATELLQVVAAHGLLCYSKGFCMGRHCQQLHPSPKK